MAEDKVPEAGAAKAIVEMTAEARAHALHACRRILRPLVKILIRAGVRFDEFHNDSTTISFCGSYRAAGGRRIRGRSAPCGSRSQPKTCGAEITARRVKSP